MLKLAYIGHSNIATTTILEVWHKVRTVYHAPFRKLQMEIIERVCSGQWSRITGQKFSKYLKKYGT